MRGVEQAFRSRTIPDEVIEEIAEKTAENGVDCRQALNLLLKVGRKADREGLSSLDSSFIEN